MGKWIRANASERERVASEQGETGRLELLECNPPIEASFPQQYIDPSKTSLS
jgi:hypothetical protein